jgi:circadian clock protein KaiC
MRIPTGVRGLDHVLDGGLQPGAVIVVGGAPGTGKTTLAQQICFANAAADRKCIYYTTLSEPKAKLMEHLQVFSFFDPNAVGSRVEIVHLGDFLQSDRAADGLDRMVKEIVRKALDEKPAIIVIDSAKMLHEFADERQLRTAMYTLVGLVASSGAVVMMLGEYTAEELRSGIEFSLADGIIQIEYEDSEPANRRWMRVTKMRGGPHRSGRHTLRIGNDGIEVFPRIESLVPTTEHTLTGRILSGIPGLDDLMDGGAHYGSSTLMIGPSGTGKTTFALGWLAHGLKNGEDGIIITFRETAGELTQMAASFGWDLETAIARSQLVILHVPLDDLDLDVLATNVRTVMTEQRVSRVIAGGLAEMVFAAQEWERLPAYLRSFAQLVRAAGGTLMATSESVPYGLAHHSLDSLMYLFDNVVRLGILEDRPDPTRTIQIVKMRTSAHDLRLHAFSITGHGPKIGDPVEQPAARSSKFVK